MSEEEQLSGEELEEEEEEEVEPEQGDAPAAEEAPAGDSEAAPAPPVDDNEPPAEEGGDEDAVQEERRPSRVPPPVQEVEPESMTEAEMAMLAAKKRHEEEQALKMMDSESRRKAELQQVEEELRVLKERQVERRKQRAIEEQEFALRRKQDEERHRREGEARKQKLEADRARRQEEKMRKNMMMAGALGMESVQEGGGPNFVVNKSGKPSNLINEEKKNKFGLSKEQKEEQKNNFMAALAKPDDVSGMLPNDIKDKIKKLHAKIIKLETEKYDLEKREERQGYDLKELFEREKQVARQKALKAGVEPTEEENNSRRPGKKNIASKFDRQVDRRSYGDRRELFENPAVKLPPSIARGSGRPPAEWGRKEFEELENIRKNLEPFRYQELAPVEGDLAKPPVPVVPLTLPTEDFDPSLAMPVKNVPNVFGTKYEPAVDEYAAEAAQAASELVDEPAAADPDPAAEPEPVAEPEETQQELEIVEEPVDGEEDGDDGVVEEEVAA